MGDSTTDGQGAIASPPTTTTADDDDDNGNANDDEAVTLEQKRKTAEKLAAIAEILRNSCSCRKSKCLTLYCGCFNQGIGCRTVCKCKMCQNPKGKEASTYSLGNYSIPIVNAIPAPMVEGQPLAVATSAVDTSRSAVQRRESKYLLMLTVSPGRLGLTLEMMKKEGEGAIITHIDPSCTFLGQVDVGDQILSIDGAPVTKLQDFLVGNDRERKFGILKHPPKRTFPIPTDLFPERKIMAEVLQHDRKNNTLVSLTKGLYFSSAVCFWAHTHSIIFAIITQIHILYLDPSSNWE